ncbi:MAG: serine/threonine protein kinase [Lachnospiraceae bacterium]|nr:serine/threonine protein kinase [Lachnospiraceae bacterium]
MDQFEILRELGRGGTSIVYLVADRADRKNYAMKVLRRDDSSKPKDPQESAERLRKETAGQLRAEATVLELLGKDPQKQAGSGAGKSSHDKSSRDKSSREKRDIERQDIEKSGCEECIHGKGIPTFIECVCDENGDFAGFVMEYVEGRSLQQILEEGKKFSIREAAEAGMQLCAILGRLHWMNPPMIYRDLKPANILVRSDGTLVVVDFGAVRKYREGAGKDTSRLGTEGYAAPEQYGGWEQSDERTDIYGIGAVLHHMITGRPPLETGLRPLGEFGSADERVSRNYSYMAKTLLRCCSVAPSMRYSSCAELEKALLGVIRLCEKAGADGTGVGGTRSNGPDAAGTGTDGASINAGSLARRAAHADTMWRKFTLLIGIAVVFLVCSGMLAASSAEAGEREYRILIKNAQEERGLSEKTETYRRAVRARPVDSEAHLAFLRELMGDYVITREEKEALESVFYTANSVGRMREKRPGEYARFEMEVGWCYFACWEGGMEAARAAFENAGRAAGLWGEGRKVAAAMGVVLSETWTRERIEGWRVLERAAIREALRSGEGIFAAAVCRAAVTEVALFPDRFEEVGADPDAMKEVKAAALQFMDEVEKGRVQVPERIREELRGAIDSL